MYLETTNKEEIFQVELMSANFEGNPPESEDFYYVSIYRPLNKKEIETLIKGQSEQDEIKSETAIFYNLEDAKDVYMTFVNWSIKGMHTFEQRALLLKELEQYHNKTKFKVKD